MAGIKGDYLNSYIVTAYNTPGGTRVAPASGAHSIVAPPSGLLPATSAAAPGLAPTVTVNTGELVADAHPHSAHPDRAVPRDRSRRHRLRRRPLRGSAAVSSAVPATPSRWNSPMPAASSPTPRSTYRGVPVGRVGDMRLTKTGIEVDLDITTRRRSRPTSQAVVTDRSVIGEQYVDLRPRTKSRPVPRERSHIAVERHANCRRRCRISCSAATSSSRRCRSGRCRRWSTSWTTPLGAPARICRNCSSPASSSSRRPTTNLPSTISLLDNSQTVLATQQQESGAITTFSANLSLIGDQLRSSNGDITKVITTRRGGRRPGRRSDQRRARHARARC